MDRWWGIFERLMWADGKATLYALAGIILLTCAEFVFPAEEEQSARGRLRNFMFLVQFKVLGLAALAVWYGWGPQVRIAFPEPGQVARIGLVFANLFAIDFLYYWYHRAQHHFDFLWAIHELHHSDAELNATSSYRTYWLEAPIQTMFVIGPTTIFFGFLGPSHGRLLLGFSLFFLIFAHSNLRLRLGPLTGWVIGPQVHRVHHSRLPEHRDRNFAQTFPVLDRLFGSYYAPGQDEFPPTGAEGLASDASLSSAMMQPFRIWFGLVRRSLGGAEEQSRPE
jgi:sterol desaturase/sphingolipid hydroxylase (fatty acid hydroxylase superfamily)